MTMNNYFIMRYHEYTEFVRNESASWLAAGYTPGTIDAEDLRNEYSPVITFMDYDEAWDQKGIYENVYSLDALTGDIYFEMYDQSIKAP